MSAKNEYLIVIPVNRLPKRQFVNWPLHITIVPWFDCQISNFGRLDQLLKIIATKYTSIEVKIGPMALFGKNKDLPVRLISPNQWLADLHCDVFKTLETNGFLIHQHDFLGTNYRPHITLNKTSNLATGDYLTLANLTLIKQLRLKSTGTMVKQVVAEYKLL